MDELPQDQNDDRRRDNAQSKRPDIPPPPGYSSWTDVSRHAARVAQKNGLVDLEAVEAAQESLVNLIQRYWDSQASKWLLKNPSATGLVKLIAKSRAMDAHRSRTRRREVQASECIDAIAGEGARDACASDASLSVIDILNGADLTKDEEFVIRGRILCDPPKTYKELGDQLGRSVHAVRGLVNRGFAKLRKCLNTLVDEPDEIGSVTTLRLAADTDEHPRTQH